MDVFDDHWEEDEEERSQSYCGGGGRFGARWQKPRSKSHHQLLLMDSVGNGNGKGAGVDGDGCASEDEEIVPLPEYERLSQSARLPHDPDPKNPLLPEFPAASPPPPPPMPRAQQKKPAAWRLIEYVRSRNRPSGCSSDGDSRSSDGEKEGDDVEKSKKQRSSWLPDRERRWPVQGFYGEKEREEEGGGEEGKKEEKNKKRSSWLPDPERRWPVQGFY